MVTQQFIEPQTRIYKTFTYKEIDRVPDVEFGYWPQTIQAWVKQGFPQELVDTIGDDAFSNIFADYFGLDQLVEGYYKGKVNIPVYTDIDPPYEIVVLEEDEETEVRRDRDGTIARWYKHKSGFASIPQYLEYPVKNRLDWGEFKKRLRIESPVRKIDPKVWDQARKAAAAGFEVTSTATGFYGQLRNWLGVEGLSYLLYDDPALVEEMLDHHLQLILNSLEQVPDDVPIHRFSWWEDMCFNYGPLISPRTFEKLMVPLYKRVTAILEKHGCCLQSVDCDGLIHDLVPGWLDAGINIMFPCEVAAGTDMFMLRKKYGKKVLLQGGIDKRVLISGKDAIDKELERIAPLLEQGGYIPHLDHLIPPDVTLKNYLYYLEQKWKLIGKE
ncbi:MAG: hypothetical protein HPY71_11610 [Firmicutes bacterium]|nr:hypothetical protein [Bacillota bacterium]